MKEVYQMNKQDIEIRKQFGPVEIAQVKSLSKKKRNELLMKVKDIDELSMRQAARILGVSSSFVFRALLARGKGLIEQFQIFQGEMMEPISVLLIKLSNFCGVKSLHGILFIREHCKMISNHALNPYM
jgi:uncharacterized protein (DUF1778 family)